MNGAKPGSGNNPPPWTSDMVSKYFLEYVKQQNLHRNREGKQVMQGVDCATSYIAGASIVAKFVKRRIRKTEVKVAKRYTV